MPSQEELRDFWLRAPEGKLCGREQAKAWALREVWLLKPGFILKSKAFMTTYNSQSFTPATFVSFKMWVKDAASRFGARAWAACVEENAVDSGMHDTRRWHLHAYFYWTDGVGVFRRNLDDFKFEEVWPRVDKCVVRSDVTPRTVACHGLWYVTVMKAGTLNSATNYKPFVHFCPQKVWLQKLWDNKKLSHEQFLSLSLTFRTGHSARKREVMDLQHDESADAAHTLVTSELSALHRHQPLRPLERFEVVEQFIAQLDNRPSWRRASAVKAHTHAVEKSQSWGGSSV
jgi:hypothetical protein